jgi:hypothetical protein
MDNVDPPKTKERREIDEPNVAKSRTETLLPRRPNPYKEQAEPMRRNERQERLEPRLEKSRTLTLLPMRVIP